jgi:phage shock protein PspC (stress-responsive transcriptional regulator)
MAGPSERPRLRRSRQERVLFGVCGGLADYFGVDPNLVRIGFVLAALFPPLSAFSLLGYLLLAVILPQEGSEDLPGRERVQRNLEELRTEVTGLAGTVRSTLNSAGRGQRAPDAPATPYDMAEAPLSPATPSTPPPIERSSDLGDDAMRQVRDVTSDRSSSSTPEPTRPAGSAGPTGSAGPAGPAGSLR